MSLVKYTIVLCGPKGSGKTQIIFELTGSASTVFANQRKKNQQSSSSCVDDKTKHRFRYVEDKQNYELHMHALDCMHVHDDIVKRADGFICMFDVTRKSTFDEMKDFVRTAMQARGRSFPIIIVGNKCSLVCCDFAS